MAVEMLDIFLACLCLLYLLDFQNIVLKKECPDFANLKQRIEFLCVKENI